MEIYLRIRRIACVCVCVALLIPCGVHADTALQLNAINENTTWKLVDSPFIIQGDIFVNAVLTIEAGVTVRFDGNHRVIIGNNGNNGTLIAMGAVDNNITFTAPGNTIIGASLEFAASAADAVFLPNDASGSYQSGSILEYVVVEKIGGATTDGVAPNGAVVISGAHPYIHNSIFRNNGASGVYASGINGLLRVEGNTFESNSGLDGAGMFITTSTPPSAQLLVRGNNFLKNTATGNGGGLNVTLANAATLTLTGNTIDANQAGFKGGGVYLAGPSSLAGIGNAILSGNKITHNDAVDSSGGLLAKDLTLLMSAETVSGNTAIQGGGLGLFDTKATITTSMLSNNTATIANGGGLVLYGGNSIITDTVFASNSAPKYHGGAIDLHKQTLSPVMNIERSVLADNLAATYGAAISFTDGTAVVTNSAIVQNRMASALAIFQDVSLLGNTIAYNTSNPKSAYLGSVVGVDRAAAGMSAGNKISGNNFLGNGPVYDIFSGIAGELNVMSNWWGTTVVGEIAKRLRVANTLTDSIVFDPPLSQANPNAPISPPPGLTTETSLTSIKLTWQNNPEINRVTGYKVYWGNKPSPDFTYQADVPLSALSYEILGLAKGNHYVAVTAYENALISDDLATPVNEKQTWGHESWYSGKKVVLVKSDLAVSVKVGSTACINAQCKTGDLMWHEITVTNSIGPSDALAKITLTDTIPAGMQLADTLPTGCAAAGTVVTCTLAPIELNASTVVKIPMTVTETGSKTVSNLVEISSPDDPDPTNNQATLDVFVNPLAVIADLSVTLTYGGIVAAQQDRYTVEIKNNGPETANNIKLTLTASTGFVANPQKCVITDNVMTCDLGVLLLGEKFSMETITTMPGSGDFKLVAQVQSDEVDTTPANNAAVATRVPDTGTKKKGGGAAGMEWFALFFVLFMVRRARRYFSGEKVSVS